MLTKRKWSVVIVTMAAFAAGYSWFSIDVEVPPDDRIMIAVLGDSDSHSYHDSVLLTEPRMRGGLFRKSTYQWTEVLAILRGTQVYLGQWGVWGMRGKVAAVMSALGLEGRAPRKEDYRFNFAVSGARCEDLLDGHSRQTERLIYLMRKYPLHWENGVVVIRIGINSIGRLDDLEEYATSGLSPNARARIERCEDYVRRSMRMIRAEHPKTAIVVAGMSDDRNLPDNFERWRTAREMGNISQVFDWYEQSLEALCAEDARAVFVSDRRWFATFWGARDNIGVPAYKAVSLGGATAITNTVGDHPKNVTLSDGHAGTVSNGLWAANLIALLRSRFDFKIAPIADTEIAHLADPDAKYGIAAGAH